MSIRPATWSLAAATVIVAIASPSLAQSLSYEKYQLKNGMTVILHVDRSLPMVAVNTWYRVGAREEPRGRSGFAHLFEHLMFMGTARVPGNDFDVIMETGGGANNASTSLDRTNYFSWGPSSLLPTLLWLDADRLEDVGRTMDKSKLDKQRDVVRNEIRQNVENTPYGKAQEEITRYMYPEGHPYHLNVYGTHEDLEAATVANVKEFFGTFYVPSNASMVVAGDFDPGQVKPMIEALFGSLPAGAPVVRRKAEPVRLTSPVRATMLDKVQQPLVMMAWHSPAQFAEGDAEMDLVAALLTSGKTSRLYKRLVLDEKLAVEVQASQNSAGLGSLFMVQVFTKPDTDLAWVEAVIDEEIARLAKDGPTSAELAERQAAFESGKLSALQSLLAKADKLNEYEYTYGEPNSFKRDFDRYRNASVEGVKAWAARVMLPDARAIVHVVPEEPAREKSARDARPADLSPAAFAPAAPERFTLSSGLPVMLWRKPELPLVAMSLQMKPGGAVAPADRAGLGRLVAQMLTEGAGDRDAVQFSSAVQSLGASLTASASQEAITVSMQTLKRNLDAATALMADAVRRPRMDSSDWERVKRLHLEALRQQDEEPTIVAARVGLRQLYGPTSPLGRPVDGTVKTVEPLSLDDVKARAAELVKPDGAVLLVAGDISVDEAKRTLERTFGDWRGTGRPTLAAPVIEPAAESGLRVLIVDRPDAVQTVIRVMAPAVKATDASRPSLEMIGTLLGGSFTSRLNQNLRERNGFTYGAGSRFVLGPWSGHFIASTSVKTEVTGPALKEILRELDRLTASGGGDISDDEIVKARKTLRTDTVQTFEGLGRIVALGAELDRVGLPFESVAGDLAAHEKLSAKDLNAIAGNAIALKRGVLVLVGDKGKILEQIKDLGLPPATEVDALGEPAKR